MSFVPAVRDAVSRFYGKHDTLIRIFFKFAAAFFSFAAIRSVFGQNAAAGHPLILLVLAAVCALLPSNAVLLVGSALIVLHFYTISLEAALVGGGVLLTALLLYFSMAPRSAWPLVSTALSMGIGIGCAPALVFGLIGGPLSALGVAFGAFIYYLIRTVWQYGGNLRATSTEAAEAMLERMAELIGMIISNREMLVMMIALSAALLTVYFVRTLAIRYAWITGGILGCLIYLIVRICAVLMMGMELPIPGLIIEIVVSLFAVWIARLLLFDLDYKKTETVRFEDDEYYYYVKAVPKRKIRRKNRRRRAERR